LACDIASRSAKALDQPRFDRIAAICENDRNCRGRSLSRGRYFGPTERKNDRDAAAKQLVGQGRQSIVVTVRPALLNCDVATLDVAGFAQALPEPRHELCVCIIRLTV